MASGRDRAQGWQHAKRSGHENERLVAEWTAKDPEVRRRLLQAAHKGGCTVDRVGYGSLCESDVGCILGGKTKSKTDMWLFLSDGTRLNVSIKKDEGGQVFLIGIDRFIAGFEQQYHRDIPKAVKRALSLYFGSAEDTADLIEAYGSRNKGLERRKHRLVGETLRAYDESLYLALLQWIDDHMGELFDFCFAKGLTSDPEDQAHLVWYINRIGENRLDTILYLPDVARAMPPTAAYGTKNGGSTIQLPFGFVQWHSPTKKIPGDLQFHHSYQKITGRMG